MSCVYLVKRGPMPEYQRAPYHPVVICGKRQVAKWEAGWTGDASWIWSHERGTAGGGWLIERWKGFDIDYGGVVRGGTLPDGVEMFSHRKQGRDPWPLISGAIWWDDRRMPGWLEDAGVVYPPDRHSQQMIVNHIAGNGFYTRPVPDFWPIPAPNQTWEIESEPRIPNGARVQIEEGIGCYATPATATVEALIAEFEPPNGRYMDSYRLRLDDGREASRYRDHLERGNPGLIATPTPEEPA